jgi:hypothetical protein
LEKPFLSKKINVKNEGATIVWVRVKGGSECFMGAPVKTLKLAIFIFKKKLTPNLVSKVLY